VDPHPHSRRRAASLVALAAVAALPFAASPAFPWLHAHAQWGDLLVPTFFAVWLASGAWRSSGSSWPVAGSVLLYLVVQVASLIWGSGSGDPRRIAAAALLGGYLLMARLGLSPDTPGGRALGRVVAATSVLLALLAVGGEMMFLAGRSTLLVGGFGDLVPGAYARIQATFPSPNLLASYTIFASGVVDSGHTRLDPRLRAIVQGCLAVTVLLTFSRGALVFVAAWLFRHAPRTRKLVVLGTLAALAVLTLANVRVGVVPPSFAVSSDESLRLQALRTAWGAFTQHPILGTGPGTSPGIVETYPYDAHCTPLQVVATLGVLGFAAFLAVTAASLRGARGAADGAMIVTIVALFVDGLAQDVDDFRHVWVGLGLVPVSGRVGTGPAGHPEPR
jgi:hypothetical protein